MRMPWSVCVGQRRGSASTDEAMTMVVVVSAKSVRAEGAAANTVNPSGGDEEKSRKRSRNERLEEHYQTEQARLV